MNPKNTIKMKTVFTLLAATALIASCAPQTPEATSAKGAVIDASMNNVMIVTPANDTLTFSTTTLNDSNKMIGIFIGDTIDVAFAPIEGDEQPNYFQATDVKLVYRPAFYYLTGAWVEPNPIDPAAVQGFVFNADSTASSINMATLVCSKWAYADGALTLTLTSKGNKVETTLDEVFQVTKLDADSLVLSQNGAVVWQLAHPQR